MEITQKHLDFIKKMSYKSYRVSYVDEIISEACLQLVKAKDKFDPSRNVKETSWIGAIVKNAAASIFTRRNALKRGGTIEHLHIHFNDGAVTKIFSNDEDAEGVAIAIERRTLVQEIVQKAVELIENQKHKTAIKFYLKGLTPMEIGPKMNLTSTAVSVYVTRAKQDLKRILSGNHLVPMLID